MERDGGLHEEDRSGCSLNCFVFFLFYFAFFLYVYEPLRISNISTVLDEKDEARCRLRLESEGYILHMHVHHHHNIYIDIHKIELCFFISKSLL